MAAANDCGSVSVAGWVWVPIWRRASLATGTAIYLWGATALAQPQTEAPGAQPDYSAGLWTRGNLLGDPGGVRSELWNLGVTLGLQDTNEVWGNLSGGGRQGARYDGLTLMGIGIDTQRAFGWQGGTVNVSALQIRGRNIAVDNLLNLQLPSGILAQPTTRLWEVWFQQSFLDGRLDLKLGQQSIDLEFITSAGSGLFLNAVMGWPILPTADLYAGGPAYPLSSLGVRLRAQPGGGFTTLLGVFDDNPPGGPFKDDSQLRGSSSWGGNFSLRTGALMIGEVQYALNQPGNGEKNSAGGADAGLSGTYKLGFWYDSGAFPDQRFDNTGRLLADPASTRTPGLLRNNFSLYAVADQIVWRPLSENSPRAVDVFVRLMGAPGDRNLISFSVNAGITLKAPFEGRDDDTVGIGFGIAKVSSGARAFDVDVATFSAVPSFVRSTETFIEATYQASVAPWWQVQPDFQYVFNPAGGVANPNDPTRRIGNEAILGLRNVITF